MPRRSSLYYTLPYCTLLLHSAVFCILAMKIARELKKDKATFYGAYWCKFCDRERQGLGREAFALVDYVECDPEGAGADPKRCAEAGVRAYVGPSQIFSCASAI